MKKLEFEMVEEGLQIDTLNNYLPNAVHKLTDEEMEVMYGGTVGCNCKWHGCNHCAHVECLKLCKTKVFGDNTTTVADTTGTVRLL